MSPSDPLFELKHCKLDSNVSLYPLQESSEIAKRLATMEPWLALGYKADTLATYLVKYDPGLHRYVIEYAGHTAGVLSIRYPWLRGPYIELLGVFPETQGLKIGSTVIRWISHNAKCREKNLWVMVSAFNTTAKHFYQANGFCQIAVIPGLITERTEEHLLRKIL